MSAPDGDIADALAERVATAAHEQRPLCIRGRGSKPFYGHRVDAEPIDVAGHSGIVSYEPSELVLTARAGTALSRIDELLVSNGQMLSFEPPSFDGDASVGGAVAAGLAGPSRPWGGAPRDHLLGVRLLDGRGRILRFGGEVMKNVAGYDVSRLMAGALGTLGVLLEVSLKVLPAPIARRHLVLEMGRDAAVDWMRELARQPVPLTGACHVDGRLHLRLAGNEASVASWASRIGGDGPADTDFWTALRDHRLPFFDERPLWRVSLPAATPRLACEQDVLTDWGGGQRWVHSDVPVQALRDEVAKSGGHAILFRHGDDRTPVFHPLDGVRERLHRGLKRVFDPVGILNPGRQYPGL